MLVVAVWYLMIPPWKGAFNFDPQAPLSKWSREKHFQTEADCRAFRQDAANRLKANHYPSPSRFEMLNDKLYTAGRCVHFSQ